MDSDDDGKVNSRGWEMVPAAEMGTTTTSTFSFSDELSIFPPNLHEGLTPTLTLDPIQQSKQQEYDDVSAAVAVGDHVSRMPLISQSARRLADSVTKLIRSKLSSIEGCGCNGGAFWSFAAMAGLAGVLMYASRRHRRERELLLLMLLEKDQRIDQLMNQIVKLSEILAANHKIPVLKKT